MYTFEAAVCTSRSAMDLVPFPNHIVTEPVASDFYLHPYGGVARDIEVSRTGFMRFFDLDEIGMKLVYHPDFYGKVLDRMYDYGEALGYRGHRRGVETWSITIIDHSGAAIRKHLERVGGPFVFEVDPKPEIVPAEVKTAKQYNAYEFGRKWGR